MSRFSVYGMEISAGLSLTNALAKVASKHRKPMGFPVLPGRAIAAYLETLPAEKVWGVGPATMDYLSKMGVKTALGFAASPRRRSGSGSRSPVWGSD